MPDKSGNPRRESTQVYLRRIRSYLRVAVLTPTRAPTQVPRLAAILIARARSVSRSREPHGFRLIGASGHYKVLPGRWRGEADFSGQAVGVRLPTNPLLIY